jgi:secreted trypsin-like serine protease
VGGNETGINEFPMMAGLYSLDVRMISCGASIISQRHVLTAAHCLTTLSRSTTGVLVGEHDISTGERWSLRPLV